MSAISKLGGSGTNCLKYLTSLELSEDIEETPSLGRKQKQMTLEVSSKPKSCKLRLFQALTGLAREMFWGNWEQNGSHNAAAYSIDLVHRSSKQNTTIIDLSLSSSSQKKRR